MQSKKPLSKNGGLTDAALDQLFRKRLENQAAYAAENYRQLVDMAKAHATPLASHDDTTRPVSAF